MFECLPLYISLWLGFFKELHNKEQIFIVNMSTVPYSLGISTLKRILERESVYQYGPVDRIRGWELGELVSGIKNQRPKSWLLRLVYMLRLELMWDCNWI